MYVAWLKDLRISDLPRVGGKNASLGEMIGRLSRAGARVPGGYATPAEAFQAFLSASSLDGRIAERIETLDPRDVDALARCGVEIRGWIEEAPFPAQVEKDIRSYYQQLASDISEVTSFAVRSSATAEDLPDASFAGQQETFLNIRGADHVLAAIRRVFASLYNDRAISYRAHRGFAHGAVAISAAGPGVGFRRLLFHSLVRGRGGGGGAGWEKPGRFLRPKADAGAGQAGNP